MSHPPGGPDLPAWADDDRRARAAWSRLVEPGDVLAGAAVLALGAVPALRHVLVGRALPDEVAELVPGGTPRRRLHDALVRWRVRLDHLDPDRDLRVVRRLGGRVLVPGDDEWPRGLDDLGVGAPPCLWVRGEPDVAVAAERSVAVVGARASTPYGEHVAADLAAGLAERGLTVVSGGAFGIDASAHRGALAAGGLTCAVLACGVDRAYPRAHEDLLRRVVDAGGLVLAEVPPGSMPSRWRFLERNRLIAALAGATVVVEAAWRSGALSTAQRAAGLGRPLGAVPGPVTSPTSAGCHRMLRDLQATCVTDAAEVAELVLPIGAVLPEAPRVPLEDHDDLGPDDVRVLDALPVRRGRSVGSLAQVAGLPEPVVAAGLGRLELLGLAARESGLDGVGWRRLRSRRPEQLRPDGGATPVTGP